MPSLSRFYGDENSFTVNFNGLVNSDTSSVVSGLTVSSSAATNSNVGSYAIGASGAIADNYSINYSLGSLTVVPAPLTVSIDDATRRYGDADPVFTYSIGGLKNNDTAGIVTISNLSSLATADAGIGDYGIIGFPFVSSPNYTAPAQVSGTLTITPRPLTITADDATRVYGDRNPALTATFTGLASFDTPALFGDLGLTTQATQSSGIGNWGITFPVVTNRNYAITSQFGTLTITPAPLSIVIADAQRAYGQANPLFTSTLLGLKNDDTAGVVSGLTLSTVARQLSDAGTYAITGSGTSLNYALTFVPGTLTVDRLSATIRLNNAGRIFGDSLTSFLASYAGFLPADLSLAQSAWLADAPDDPLLRPGSYAVAIEEASPEARAAILKNYDVNFVPGQLTIARKVVEVKAVDVRSDTTAVSNAFPVEIFGLVPFGPSFTAVAGSNVGNSAPPGNYPIVPVITEVVGMSVEELNHYYDFRMTPGVLTLVVPLVVQDVVDLNNPGVLLQNTTNHPLIVTDVFFENETIEVKQDTITVQQNVGFVDYSTNPLTQAEYADYFGSYIDDAETVRTALASGYKSLLSGKGVKGSSYENMPADVRELLAGWMDGSLEPSAFQALIAQGDANAIAAFSFILPSLVEMTLSKDMDEMTSLDREVLGRLADLTEKRHSDTVRIAQQKYEAMLETQRKKAEIGGMGTLFTGPGDFKNIVQSATEEALSTYILASAGAVGGVAGTVGILTIPAIGNAIFVNSGVAVMAGASGGFAIAATMMVCLAVRAVQIDESIKNEKAYHDLMSTWRLG
ncbi:MAG TPA: MBG domain-containing protein, partial [Opitutus sp.]|nr:MBG domain-containing protein [Opitutus sp.]